MPFPSGDLTLAQAFFGAIPSQDGVLFRIWAPDVRTISVELLDGSSAGPHPLASGDDGIFETWVRGAAAGDTYVYRVDDGDRLPDPASRYQPQGVHGPSQVVDPAAYQWRDQTWRSRSPGDTVLYELHVGTFTTEGTFAAAREKLAYLRDLGVTVVELMPVADFPGARNWGYDGVALFAPARAYGSPDDLRALVDAAHGLGLSVMLDVVYNHLGPEGAYLPRFSRRYHTDRHSTPWGTAVNLDGPDSRMTRQFILDNAVHWVREYHLDGLRLDATHALIDTTDPHIVAELVRAVRGAGGRPVFIHAEDHRHQARMIEAPERGGWGLDGVWADDFHHVMRRMTAGDSHGYFSDFAGNTGELATVLRQGWLPAGHAVPLGRFIICLQNHDQVGNRALGDRLHHSISEAAWRAASVVLLTAPMTPLLFMGQEWAASTPFQYFTDLDAELGRRVTEGRSREFSAFPEFSSVDGRHGIPDPQDASTFTRSRLAWAEQQDPHHARALALYRQLLSLRMTHTALGASPELHGEAAAPNGDTVVIRRSAGGETFWIAASFAAGGEIELAALAASLGHDLGDGRLDVVLETEHAEFAADPRTITVSAAASGASIHFSRPGAIVLRQS